MSVAEFRQPGDPGPIPLTPRDCDLRDFPRMMIDIPRLRGSSFDVTDNDSAWRAGFNLWMTAWHQVPAASLDAEEASLTKAAGLGRDVKTWRKVSDIALRGWRRGSDGRLYHPVIAEIALEAWLDKLGHRLSSGAGNAKRYSGEFDPAPTYRDIRDAALLLGILNPKSRALSRQHVLKAIREVPPGVRPALPVGAPPGVLAGSQGNGMEGNSSEDKSSDSGAVVLEPDKDAWDGAVRLLRSRGDLSDKAARSFFGGLLARNGIEARDLLAAVAGAQVNGTADPQGYLTKAAQGVAKRRAGIAPRRVGFV